MICVVGLSFFLFSFSFFQHLRLSYFVFTNEEISSSDTRPLLRAYKRGQFISRVTVT